MTLRHAARNLNANLCKTPLALKGHENYVYLRADYWHPNSQNPTLGPRLEGLEVLQPLCESILLLKDVFVSETVRKLQVKMSLPNT